MVAYLFLAVAGVGVTARYGVRHSLGKEIVPHKDQEMSSLFLESYPWVERSAYLLPLLPLPDTFPQYHEKPVGFVDVALTP